MFRFVYADDTRVAGVGKPWGEGWFTAWERVYPRIRWWLRRRTADGNWPAGAAFSRVNPLLHDGLRPIINVCPPPICVGAGLPANTMAAATVNGGWRLVSRPGPFAGEPAPTRRPVSNHRCVSTTNPRRSGFTREYGSGGDGERRGGNWPAGPALSRVNPLLHDGLCRTTDVCPPPIRVGAGLPANTVAAATVNDGGGIGQQARPFRG